MSSAFRAMICAVLLGGAVASAQVIPEREVEIIQKLYDAGRYADALKRANESLAVANFSDPQRVKLHEVAGLSAFNLGDVKAAQAAFLNLLRINPDYILDPFAVPPPAIKVFDQVRRDNADALNLVRQQLALRADQEKRAKEERERLQREQDDRRRREEFLSAGMLVRTVERRSMVVNFIPFGAGQFQQQRVGWGVAFAVSEGVMAVLSIVSYFAIASLYDPVVRVWVDRLTPDGSGVFSVTTREIPASRRTERDVWTGLKYGTGIAFYALWALGIGDAIWHHQDEIITERREPLPAAKPPTTQLRIYPTPGGGIGAGVSVGF
ncbi:MAG: tetratricopeptide repeat protein [Myxococcaceae bacterium]